MIHFFMSGVEFKTTLLPLTFYQSCQAHYTDTSVSYNVTMSANVQIRDTFMLDVNSIGDLIILMLKNGTV
jgi:hypothetical protein